MTPTPKGSVNVWPELSTGEVPAQGSEPTITVPLLEVWDLESVEMTLTTISIPIPRNIQIVFLDATGVEIARGPLDGTSIMIPEIVTYHLAQFGTIPADTGSDHYDQIATNPKIRLPPGGIITTVTEGMGFLDVYSALKVMATKYYLPSDN